MEFGDKLQKLRTEHNMTQEQMAEQLFVSRTAVSKWETGKGMPNLESLQAIAKLFHITLDELLSTEEVCAIAKEENQENMHRLLSYADGFINFLAVMGLLLPLYKVAGNGVFYSAPLYQFEGWQCLFFWGLESFMVLCGIVELVSIRTYKNRIASFSGRLGTGDCIGLVLCFIGCGQPYPAVYFFILLLFKGGIITRKMR